jgi:uncharacterized protein (DUF924 family)
MPSYQDPNDNTEPAWVGEVLRFWFDELAQDDWFRRSDAVDTRIRERFLPLHERLVATDDLEATSPRQALAAVIVLDQFSRNMFRGSPQAFAADDRALRLARTAVERRFDRALSDPERLFLYLPFEHSESRDDQALAVQLIAPLGNEGWTQYALAHQVIIERFGRFPHRNATLNRPSTAAELAFLDEPMSSF